LLYIITGNRHHRNPHPFPTRRSSDLNGLHALQIQASDPEREFVTDLCWNGNDGCAGDVRLYDWQTNGYGIVQPVLFTARNGATRSEEHTSELQSQSTLVCRLLLEKKK